MASEVIAMFKFPMRVDGMSALVRTLEKCYPGEHVVLTDPENGARDGWLTIARVDPESHVSGQEADK